jgi:hypothetical protein
MAQTSMGASANLLTDPGFESGGTPAVTGGIGGWTAFGGAGFSQAQAHTGSWSMNAPYVAPAYSVPGAYQIVPAVAGDTYTMTGWVYTPNTLVSGSNDFAILQMSWYQTPTGGAAAGPTGGQTVGTDVGTPGGTPPASTVALPPGTWTYATVTGVAPSGTEGVGAYLLNINADSNANFFFDDITLVDDSVTPEPTTVALLGLAGLPALIRRRRA